MKPSRRLATFVASVATAVFLVTPAAAASNSETQTSASGPAGSASATTADCLVILSRYVSNETWASIGVQKVAGTGNYDSMLRPGQRTDIDFCWPYVHSFYIGPGYCAEAYFWN